MVEGSSGEEASSPPPAGGTRTAARQDARRPSAPASAGQATLNMNSIPASNVILNGRPLGKTPKVGVKVPAGPVTVVFAHPEMGRKVQSATVAAGSSRTFMARFP